MTPIKSTCRANFGDFMNAVKAFIGSNYLTMPYALSIVGIWTGIMLLLIISLLTRVGCVLLLEVKRHLESSHGVHTYGEIGFVALGKRGQRLVEVFLIITQTGFCIGYMIFLSSTLDDIAPGTFSHTAAIAIFTPGIILMSYIRNLNWLKPASVAANVALFAGFCAVIAYELHKDQDAGFRHTEGIKLGGIPIFFGIVTGAFEGIGCVLPIEESVSVGRDKFKRILDSALGTVTAVLLSFGIVGYLTYGEGVHDIIIKDLPSNNVTLFLRICILIGIYFTYPLQLLPVSRIVERWVLPRPGGVTRSGRATSSTSSSPFSVVIPHRHAVQPSETKSSESVSEVRSLLPVDYSTTTDDSELEDEFASVDESDSSVLHEDIDLGSGDIGCCTRRLPRRFRELAIQHETLSKNVIRTLLVFITGAIALIIPSFHMILSFNGSIGGAALAFVLPGYFHMIVFKDSNTKAQTWLNYAMMAFGIIGGVTGVAVTIKNAV
jgi:solute carrier family 36 (proton-coupled amino acid transporter)